MGIKDRYNYLIYTAYRSTFRSLRIYLNVIKLHVMLNLFNYTFIVIIYDYSSFLIAHALFIILIVETRFEDCFVLFLSIKNKM